MRAPIITSLLLSTTTFGCTSDFNVAGMKGPSEMASDTGALDDDDGTDTGLGPPDDEDPDDEAPEDTETETDTGTDTDTDTDTDTPDDDDPAPEDDCEETSDLVYVIDKDTERLFLFDPDTLGLTLLGTLDCSWMDGTPASMGVARDGMAYVRYSSNTIFEVDLATLSCTESTYADNATGLGAFGMGFATDSADTWRDQLYVANRSRVARLDTSNWQVTSLATLPSQAELTGTADGELWAFLPLESPPVLMEIDKATGAERSRTRLTSFPDPGNIDTFAFAAWGGQHYLFVRSYGMGESTEVYEVDAAGGMTRVVESLGINVVGAGVSTCAPTE